MNNRFRDIVILNGHEPQVEILQELDTEISAISRKYAGRELGGSWRTASLVNYSGNTAGPRLTRRLPRCKRPSQSRFTGFFSPASAWRPRFPHDGWSATPFPSTVLQWTQGLGLPKDRGQAKADEYSQKSHGKSERACSEYAAEVGDGRFQIVSSGFVDEMQTKAGVYPANTAITPDLSIATAPIVSRLFGYEHYCALPVQPGRRNEPILLV